MQESINNLSMLKVGTILRGTYRIDSYLSSGGFGNTYVATNIEFDELVAIKEFFMKGVTQRDNNQTTVSVSNSENNNSFLEQKEKFKKEARRLRKLKNEYIVSVHDLFDENNTAYYVMDYVDGENLAERLKRTGRPMTESEVCLIFPQILDALNAVHKEGFCHLDIKPSNIMLEKGGKIKLIDFGASKQLGVNGTLTTNAPTAFAQTPGFAPQEQMEQNFDKIGPWTDIYALGATLYNLLTNERPPLPTDIDDDITADKHESLPFPDSVSVGTRSLVLMMLNTNRLQRPQSIDAIVEAEKMREEEPKQTPKQQPTSKTTATDDDEETIIANPTPPKEEKESAPKPKPETSNHTTSQSTNASAFHNVNKSQGVDKNTIAYIVAALLVIAPLIFLNQGSCGSSYEDTNVTQPEDTKVKEANRMNYETAIGECQYTGPLDENNKPHGKGEAYFNDGRYYSGGFKHGVLEGKLCVFKYSNNDSFYGEFRNNSFYHGDYTVSIDGSYFRGYYIDGQPYSGTWYNKKGKIIEKIRK